MTRKEAPGLFTRKPRNRRAALGLLLSAMAAARLLAGCSKGAEVNGAPAPPSPAPSNATAYVGTQSPGIWTMSVDDLKNAFSYQSTTASSATSGAMVNVNGILDFGNQNGTSLGKAAEQPGVGALLRPGGIATFPIAMIQQGDCLAIPAKTRYIYTALPGSIVEDSSSSFATGYGTFVVSTSANGKAWNFTDVHNYVLTNLSGAQFTAGTENGTDPSLFSASCISANSIGTVSAEPSAFPARDSAAASVPALRFNASGTFIEDRTTEADGGWIGFVMPSGPIKPAAVGTAGAYRGFFSESSRAADGSTVPDTEAVVFAQATDGTTSLAGASIQNDNVADLPPLTQYTITLGIQDTTYNGVFPNARLIVADTNGICAQVGRGGGFGDAALRSGFDATGNPVCTAAGVGVVSQVNGKYVLYFTSLDGTRSLGPRGLVIQFYLYQQ